MTDEPYVGPEPVRNAFSALIEADRHRILADYAHRLEAMGSPVARDSVARQQTLAHVSKILTDVVESVRVGRVRVDDNYKLIAWDIGETRAAAAMPTRESWRASVAFYEAAVASLIRHVDTEVRGLFEIALLALNRSISLRMREATGAYTSYLLNRIHGAHLAERHRIARELHDRVGNGLHVAHRQLELFPVYQEDEPVRAANRVEAAHQAVLESMEKLRVMTSDLRLVEPLKSLEKALVNYIDSIPAGTAQLRLRVSGDETWAPAAVRDESFLIIREAIRNSLAHAQALMVLISVDIAPHELCAVVEDTGRGFDPAGTAQSGGTGLSAMQERAALLGGAVAVSSQPGQGTIVELMVPLPEHREDGR